MKTAMTLIAFFVVATVASAGIGIHWNSWRGEYHDGSGNAILAANGALWQLIYAGADNLPDPIHDDGAVEPMDAAAWAANNYLRPGGDDQLLAQRILPMGGGATADGTAWDVWMNHESGNAVFEDVTWSLAGFAYMRVFESAAPQAGVTFFFETAEMLELDLGYPQTPDPNPQFFSMNPSEFPFTPDRQPFAVPEPHVLALLGLGAALLLLRRRRS